MRHKAILRKTDAAKNRKAVFGAVLIWPTERNKFKHEIVLGGTHKFVEQILEAASIAAAIVKGYPEKKRDLKAGKVKFTIACRADAEMWKTIAKEWRKAGFSVTKTERFRRLMQ